MEEPALTKICRACLTEEGEMKSVFIPDERAGTNLHLAEMIMAYASVQVNVYEIVSVLNHLFYELACDSQ